MKTSTVSLATGILSLGIAVPFTYMSGSAFFDVLDKREDTEARMQEIAAERIFLESKIYDCLANDGLCQALTFQYEVLNQEYSSLEKDVSSLRFTVPLSGLASMVSLGLGIGGIYFFSQYPAQRKKDKKKEEGLKEDKKELENLYQKLDERIKAEKDLRETAYKAGAKK